jgi:hypothetical protein
MGQELIQMVNAGWSPASQIMKQMNWDMPEFRKQMEAGAISAAMVGEALRKEVEAGGMYFGFLEELEGTSARTYDRMLADLFLPVLIADVAMVDVRRPTQDVALQPVLDPPAAHHAAECARGVLIFLFRLRRRLDSSFHFGGSGKLAQCVAPGNGSPIPALA